MNRSPGHIVGWLAAGALVAALGAVPVLTGRNDVLNLLFFIFLYAALAQSWNLLAGYTGQVSLGHAAFFGAGAFIARHLWSTGWPFFLAWPAGGLAAVALALAVGYPALRLRGVYFAIGTLALAEILRITIGNVLPTVAPMPPGALAAYSLTPRYYLALGLVAASTAFVLIVTRSKVGLALMAVREDEDAARASGVGALGTKILALVLSSFMAGLCGGLFAFHQVSYYYNQPFSPLWTFDALLITFVGGVGTIWGPIIGAVFFMVLREIFALTGIDVHVLVFGLLFIAVVLIWPGGLLDAIQRGYRLVRRLASSG
ncbi:MAG: branched-chain amino acid ABC transporter permease [Proteobacteria bacterium]|nr:branched-chain amino acid ABC transporter permease [Pseudomonadota bacterium]